MASSVPPHVPSRPFLRPKPKAPLHCGPVALTKLARRWGTPLYVYSADAILERLRFFTEAFQGLPHLICYAVKANSSLAILKLLADHGAGFDIVSGGELERVLAVDRRAASRVVFSGVGKTKDELDLALRTGIRVFNVESAGELELLAERARRQRKVAPFALRVNPDVFAETHPYISTGLSEHKFGVALAEARELYRKARGMKSLRAVGVSVHIGSQIREAAPFAAAASRVTALVRELRAEGERHLHQIDLGGGLGIEYDETQPWDPKARVDAYAAAVRTALGDGLGLELTLEPGRFLVAQAGALLTEVLYIKRNGRKQFVVTDAGMNDLIRPSLYSAHHAIEPVAPDKGEARATEVVDVVGPVCESGDFFAHDRALPPVKPGDLLAVLDAGAYGMSLSSNYNSRPRSAEVMVEGKRARLIRRRETMRDLMKPEKV